ncbi:cytidine deaminase-like protein [Xylariomycetidae sp. FL0641]|nr:cytidine deaminase-like protein [Xylariomycetidae sp. FL0641]
MGKAEEEEAASGTGTVDSPATATAAATMPAEGGGGGEGAAGGADDRMADHKISGYMLSLWQVLFAPFAPFIQLLARLFRFASTEEEESPATQAAPPGTKAATQTQPSSSSASSSASASASAQSTGSSSSSPLHVSPQPQQQLPAVSSSSPTRLSPPDDEVLQHTRATRDTQATQDACVQRNGSVDPSSAGDNHHSDHDRSEKPAAMPAAKKRGGQKRGGVKAAACKPAAPNTAAAAGQSNGSVTSSSRQGDTRPSSTHSDGQAPPVPKNAKENAAPSKAQAVAVPRFAQGQPPVPGALAVVDNMGDSQSPATRSGKDKKPPAANTKPANGQVADADPDVEKLGSIVDRLTLDEAPSTAKSPEQNLTKATNAAEASALPVPLVVAVPLPTAPLPKLDTTGAPSGPVLPGLIEPKTPAERAEREYHLTYMRQALDMGNLALNTNETPVGCVLVYHGRTIAKGMNATNVTRNGTRHAEFMALSALLSRGQSDVGEVNTNPALDDASWGDVDPSDGHVYPYGQKLHPAPVVDRSIISECILYVTVEPCVMCASLLRQLGVKKVYFGAVNDKFGGTGGVFRIHQNSKPVSKPTERPYQNGYGPPDSHRISKGRTNPIPRTDEDGDGGNVEPGYPVEGGYLRDDAVSLLRRFYVQENGRAPQPRKKEGRAARLFAMENQAKTGSTSETSDNVETPVEADPSTTDTEQPVALNSGSGV